jgi:reactive intermediate/imine deaminase
VPHELLATRWQRRHIRSATSSRDAPDAGAAAMSAPRFINPPTIAKPPGFTHVVIASGGTTIYIAGQVPLDVQGNLVGAGDFRAQTRQVFENLKSALAAAGATFNDVVKLNNYFVDMSNLPLFREVRDQYVNTSVPPASTTVEVRRLYRDDVLVEVEAIAVMP